VDIKNETEEFVLLIVIIIVISTVIITVVVTGILIRKRRASKDEVAKFYRLKGQEKQLKGGVELEEPPPLTSRESIIKKAEKAKEKEKEYNNLPGWYSPSEKVRVEEDGNAVHVGTISLSKYKGLIFWIIWIVVALIASLIWVGLTTHNN